MPFISVYFSRRRCIVLPKGGSDKPRIHRMHQLQLKTLKKPVCVCGRDVLGRKSLINFEAGDEDTGWTWSPDGQTSQPINPEAIVCDTRNRNLCAHNGRHRLQIMEHVLPLLFLGLDDMHLKAPKQWPPYFMPATFWKHLEGNLQDTGEKMKWATVEKATGYRYPELRNGLNAFTRIRPHQKPTVIADIEVSYRGLGTRSKTYDLAAIPQDELLRILAVGPQGWYRPIGVMEPVLRLLRWPHIDTVVWPRFKKEMNLTADGVRARTLDRFLDHRFLDLLGALALLAKDHYLPAVHVTSVCSGHEADLHAIKEATLGEIVS